MDSATLDAPEKLQVFNQLHGKTPTNSCWFQGSQNGLDTSSSFILKMQPSRTEIMMQMLAQLFFLGERAVYLMMLQDHRVPRNWKRGDKTTP